MNAALGVTLRCRCYLRRAAWRRREADGYAAAPQPKSRTAEVCACLGGVTHAAVISRLQGAFTIIHQSRPHRRVLWHYLSTIINRVGSYSRGLPADTHTPPLFERLKCSAHSHGWDGAATTVAPSAPRGVYRFSAPRIRTRIRPNPAPFCNRPHSIPADHRMHTSHMRTQPPFCLLYSTLVPSAPMLPSGPAKVQLRSS